MLEQFVLLYAYMTLLVLNLQNNLLRHSPAKKCFIRLNGQKNISRYCPFKIWERDTERERERESESYNEKIFNPTLITVPPEPQNIM